VPQRTFYVSLSVLALPLTLASWSLSLHEPGETAIQPRVTGSRQITHDGLVKTNLASDGANLYFTELSGENSVIAKVAASGGEVSHFSVSFPNAQLLDVSSAHSSLLVAEKIWPLFRISLLEPAPERWLRAACWRFERTGSGVGARWKTRVAGQRFDSLYCGSRRR